MKNINISTKLIFLAFVASLIIAAIGFFGIRSMNRINVNLETMYKDRVIPLQQLKVISDAFAVDVVDVSHQARNGNVEWANAIRRMNKADDAIKQNWNAYLSTAIEGDEQKLVNEAKILIEDAFEGYQTVYAILSSKKDTASMAALDKFVINDLYPKIDPLTKKINELIDLQLKISSNINKESMVIFESTKNYSVMLIIFGVLFALSISIYIILNINKSLKIANEAIQSLAEGNLMVKISIDSQDEIGMMMQNLRSMVEKLKEVIAFVREASENISSASQQLSQGATEQAASTEEVSSSMEEMTANIQQNTENARQTEIISNKATEGILESAKYVNQTVDAMKTIASRISIIGDIAFQTNILALNAAVEAARAGDHGRGFAVVAAEVRKLAERSQTAASEIDSVSKNSVEIAIKSGDLLNSIVPDIQKTSRLVQEIAAASIEQNGGTAQINNALQQLNQVTQQNAASAEELSGQSEQLLSNVEFFNVDTRYNKVLKKISFDRLKKTDKNSNKKGMSIRMNEDEANSDADFMKF